MLMHEVVHTLGVKDGKLMEALGFDPQDRSDKANQKLAKDCFGVKGKTVEY